MYTHLTSHWHSGVSYLHLCSLTRHQLSAYGACNLQQHAGVTHTGWAGTCRGLKRVPIHLLTKVNATGSPCKHHAIWQMIESSKVYTHMHQPSVLSVNGTAINGK